MDYLIVEAVLVIVLILLAGLLSAADIAIASFGTNKIEELKEKNDPTAILFESIQKDPNSFYGTIQISTNLLMVASAVLGFHLFMRLFYKVFYGEIIKSFDIYSELLAGISSVLLISFLIILFSFLIPKALGFKYSERIGRASISPLIFLSKIIKYPVKIITWIGNLILIPFNEETNFYQTKMSEDEIRVIISESVKSGTLNKTEQEIIENIFEFNDLHANEVMIPRTEMSAIEMVNDKSEIMKYVIKTGHSLLPIYEDSPDNIIGVLHTKDFIKSIAEEAQVDIKSLIRPAYFVPETKLISEILKEMQKRGERLAIVTDEYGGTEGVITMEDILEEIVGDLGDTSQSEIKNYSKLPDGKYYVLGSMNISEFNEIFNIDLPESDEYNTIAGFVSYSTGKILNVGESFEYSSLTFELIKKIRQKMVQFRVYSSDSTFSAKTEVK
jgi:putative hemolysin